MFMRFAAKLLKRWVHISLVFDSDYGSYSGYSGYSVYIVYNKKATHRWMGGVDRAACMVYSKRMMPMTSATP